MSRSTVSTSSAMTSAIRRPTCAISTMASASSPQQVLGERAADEAFDLAEVYAELAASRAARRL